MDIRGILAKKDFAEPPEITAIKQYVAEHFAGRKVGVSLSESIITIKVSSAAFAGSLKNHSRQLQAAAKTTKQINFRIDSSS